MASLLEIDLTRDGKVSSSVDEASKDEIITHFAFLPGEEISYMDTPTAQQWCLPPIRQTSQTGGTLIWQVGFDPETSRLVRRRGYEITPSGKPGVINDDYVLIKTNQSKRDLQEQALLQAQKLYLDKTREGYSVPGMSEQHLLPAQLACTYRPPHAIGDKKSNERLIQLNEFKRGPVACQVKLDGQRCRSIRNQDGKVILISRTNREIEWLDHVREELSVFFHYLPDNCGLDGELYGEGLFEETSSAIRTEKRKHKDNEKIGYHIFDIIIPETILENRIMLLFNAFRRYREEERHRWPSNLT